MYGLDQYEVLGQGRKPYVVRDLSWELARYLDTEDFSAASASETPNGVSGHHLRTPENERVSG